MARVAQDLFRLAPRLSDQRAVLLEQATCFVPRLVGLLEGTADALAPLVDRLLDRAERVLLEDEERDQERDDRPDHQTRDDLDQVGGGDDDLHQWFLS